MIPWTPQTQVKKAPEPFLAPAPQHISWRAVVRPQPTFLWAVPTWSSWFGTINGPIKSTPVPPVGSLFFLKNVTQRTCKHSDMCTGRGHAQPQKTTFQISPWEPSVNTPWALVILCKRHEIQHANTIKGSPQARKASAHSKVSLEAWPSCLLYVATIPWRWQKMLLIKGQVVFYRPTVLLEIEATWRGRSGAKGLFWPSLLTHVETETAPHLPHEWHKWSLRRYDYCFPVRFGFG